MTQHVSFTLGPTRVNLRISLVQSIGAPCLFAVSILGASSRSIRKKEIWVQRGLRVSTHVWSVNLIEVKGGISGFPYCWRNTEGSRDTLGWPNTDTGMQIDIHRRWRERERKREREREKERKRERERERKREREREKERKRERERES